MATLHPTAAAVPGEQLSEDRRRPLIDGLGRRLLDDLHEHPHAPRYNHLCGDRLTAEGLAAVQAFDHDTAAAVPFAIGTPPPWVAGFVARSVVAVPRYRSHGVSANARLVDIPTVGRADLVADPYGFVPDDHPLDDLVVYTTTGTTDGQVAYVASSPFAAASYAVLLDAALRLHGRSLRGGAGRVAIAQVCWQRSTYTYASVSTFLGQGGILKLNLNPDDWRHPDDVTAFLDAVQPEIYTGDPVAFAHLAELPLRSRPTALLSSASALLPGLQRHIADRFGCPVIDVYGLTEAGPVAASLPDGSGHALLQPRLYVEILRADGSVADPGERGEITLTGGFNDACPLLRYRTGDHAALEPRGGLPVLVGLEGRAPVPLATADGRAVNTIDVTNALRELTLARYALHQHADRSLELAVDRTPAGSTSAGATIVTDADLAAALTPLFGDLPLTVTDLTDAPSRPTYSTAMGA